MSRIIYLLGDKKISDIHKIFEVRELKSIITDYNGPQTPQDIQQIALDSQIDWEITEFTDTIILATEQFLGDGSTHSTETKFKAILQAAKALKAKTSGKTEIVFNKISS